MEKITKRSSDLSIATNNARLLHDMVSQFNTQSTLDQEIEIMKVSI